MRPLSAAYAIARAVPVEVVVGHVEHRRRLGAHRPGVVELEARELEGEHVVGLGIHHRLEHRAPDVADQRRCAARPRRGSSGASATVVVLPLVPVTASHGAGVRPGRAAARPARRLPRPACPASRPRLISGASGRKPGEVTSRSASRDVVGPARRWRPRPAARRHRGCASSSARSAISGVSLSPSATTDAPRWVRVSATEKPVTPKPATTARTPSQRVVPPEGATLLAHWRPTARRRCRARWPRRGR